MKISIIGYSGAGKSTLAKRLRAIYNIDILHLDRINYIADWQERDLLEAKQLFNDFLKKDNWIIEGNFQKLNHDRRFKESDTIIFLDFPMPICLYRAFKRFLKYRNKNRDDAGDNCKDDFNFAFFWWIVFEGRTKKYRQRYQEIINKYQEKMIILKSPEAVEAYINQISNHKPENL